MSEGQRLTTGRRKNDLYEVTTVP